MKGNKQNITFELNEQLSFETGQEIEEMISISIDPDIVIQTYDEYIQVRGVVLLSGEYHRRAETVSPMNSTRNRPTNRYVEKVVNINDEVAHFSHRFPVEISVAKERVQNVEDVTVTVDSFDYELPTIDQMNIIASLHIHGITPKRERRTDSDAAIENDRANNEFNEGQIRQYDLLDSSEQGVNSSKNKEGKREVPDQEKVTETYASKGKDEVTKRDDGIVSPIEESSQVEDHPLRLVKKSEKNQSTNEPEETMMSNSNKDEAKTEIEAPVRPENSTQINEAAIQETKTAADEEENVLSESEVEQEMHIELSEGTEDDDELDVKDITFLTELFAEEAETYTQVTIYITQDEDSIESIAKRYEIPVLQLLKDNNLSADTIEAGQLITIRQQPNT